jgi:hypothetical protein
MDNFLKIYNEYWSRLHGYFKRSDDTLELQIASYEKKINRSLCKHDIANLYKISNLFYSSVLDRDLHLVSHNSFIVNFDLNSLDTSNPFEDIDEIAQKYGMDKLNLNLDKVYDNIEDRYDRKKLCYYYMSTFLEDMPVDIKIALKN